mgnify:CR=1 FL=1
MIKKLGDTIPKPLGMIVCQVVLIAVSTLTTFFPISVNVPINVVLPLIVLLNIRAEFFEKLKLSTLVIGKLIVASTVLGFLQGDWCVQIVFWLLRINILEAALTDFKKKNYLNGITGLVLIAASFQLTGVWVEKYYITTNHAMILWIIAYTIWNWNFVLHEFSSSISVYHILVLLTPLIFIILAREPGFWLIVRASSLSIAGVIQISGKKYIEEYLYFTGFAQKISTLKSLPVQSIVMTINIGLIILIEFIP